MTRILIVYHSQTGHTGQMAQAVCEGAKAIDGVEVVLKKAARGQARRSSGLQTAWPSAREKLRLHVRHAQGFLRPAPTSARRTKCSGNPLVVFISAGNDGSGALQGHRAHRPGLQIQNRLCAGGRRGNITEAVLEQCRELGGTLAGGVARWESINASSDEF